MTINNSPIFQIATPPAEMFSKVTKMDDSASIALSSGKEPRIKVIGTGAVDPHCDDCCFAFLFILQAVAMISLAGMWLTGDGLQWLLGY